MFKKGFFIFALVFTALLASCSFAIPKTQAAGLAYNYDLTYQSPYPSVLNPGDIVSVSLKIKNTGSANWENTGEKVVRLGTGSQYGSLDQNRDYGSEFANPDWLSKNRPVTISNNEVQPGEETTFQFNIKAPTAPGTYKAYFTPVTDGVEWMKDLGIYWQITVKEKDGKISSVAPIQNETKETGPSQPAEDILKTDALVDSLAPSIVKVICKTSKEYWNQGSGTLFHNSTNDPDLPQYYVTTNLHVVQTENGSVSECDIKITPDYKNKDNYLTFESKGYKSYDGLDFAILEPKVISGTTNTSSLEQLSNYAKEDKEIADKNPAKEDIGKEVLVLGYPENGDLSVSKGDILGYESYKDSKYIDTSALLRHGNSGGLAINSDGQILGIPTFVKAGDIGMILDMSYLENKIY